MPDPFGINFYTWITATVPVTVKPISITFSPEPTTTIPIHMPKQYCILTNLNDRTAIINEKGHVTATVHSEYAAYTKANDLHLTVIDPKSPKFRTIANQFNTINPQIPSI